MPKNLKAAPPVIQRKKDQQKAIDQCRTWLSGPYLLVDTETTGVEDSDEIIEICITDMHGSVLFDSLIKPTKKLLKPEIIEKTSIDMDMLKDQPTWPEVWPTIKPLITERQIVAYNAAFDYRLIEQTCEIYDIDFAIKYPKQCAMLVYAQYKNVWNSWHGEYKWHKLPRGKHRAHGDCKALLKLINKMATDEPPEISLPSPSRNDNSITYVFDMNASESSKPAYKRSFHNRLWQASPIGFIVFYAFLFFCGFLILGSLLASCHP